MLFRSRQAVAFLGVVFFEGNRLSPGQLSPCRALKVICAPSSFCRSGLLRSGIPNGKIKLVPVPLDTSAWSPEVKPRFPNEGRFRFLFMNSIYERKGLDVLLRAYWDEFSASEPV